MHPSGAEHPIFHVLRCNRNSLLSPSLSLSLSLSLSFPASRSIRADKFARKKAYATACQVPAGVTAGNTLFTRINLFSDGLFRRSFIPCLFAAKRERTAGGGGRENRAHSFGPRGSAALASRLRLLRRIFARNLRHGNHLISIFAIFG
jgi:hypothetical protein